MHRPRYVRNAVMICAAVVLSALAGHMQAQTTAKKAGVEQELVKIEMGFFDAWKTGDLAYFRSHIPENGVRWGETGTLSRQQQLDELQSEAKNCKVEGYGLSDFIVLPLATGAYLLTY